MNLLSLGLISLGMAAMPDEDAVKHFEARTFVLGSGESRREFAYRLLKPEHLEPGKTYPVVLFLHGAGERGDDNLKQLLYFPELTASDAYRAKYPCFLLAPQCPSGKKWVDVDWSDKHATVPSELNEEAQAVIGMLDEMEQKYPVDRQREYLTGLSMGGYGTWALATMFPGRFAAVVPICGGGDDAQAERLKSVPIWAVHGADDKAVPVERSRTMIEAIRRAGGHPRYTEYPGVGHQSWMPAYTDPEGVVPWMFQQKRKREGS
ncbi:MAG TPA: alpha/beta hydrolase-fold protein [Pirellulales bacterium]|jgi:predicted peptidase|nr:alpha/beta hydrolase-fold protein [Pirellulales bacterium]